MINQLNSGGAQPSGQMFGQGLSAYTGNSNSMGANPYGQVLGGATGSLAQMMANPAIMKMIADRLKGMGTQNPNAPGLNNTLNPDTPGTNAYPVAPPQVDAMPLTE